MSHPIHTSGPCRRTSEGAERVGEEVIAPVCSTDANERLLTAAYNAFDSAAKRLGLNAVELAERMHDGEIAKLVEALEAGHNPDWVHNAAITSDIEALRKICLAYSKWWNNTATPLIAKIKGGAT